MELIRVTKPYRSTSGGYSAAVDTTLLVSQGQEHGYASHGAMYKLPPNGYYVPLSDEERKTWVGAYAVNLLSAAVLRTTSGTDPEVFVVGRDGVVIPAWEFLPKKTRASTTQVFWDGFQGEFTVGVYSCHAFLVDSIHNQLKTIRSLAWKWSRGSTLVPDCVVEIPQEMMMEASADHAALGCTPSTNIYEGVHPLDIPDPRSLAIRFAGCHIHFGLYGLLPETIPNIVRHLDHLYGIISVSLLAGVEDVRRRQFYGKAGEYRTPAWGLEYRTPSSATLCHPVVANISYDIARHAVRNSPIGYRPWGDIDDAHIQSIINELDVTTARRILTENKTTLQSILNHHYGVRGPIAFRLIMEGADNLLDCHHMAATWRLREADCWEPHCASPNCCVGTCTLEGST